MNSDRSKIVPNIVTEDTSETNGQIERKARDRMVAEGYRYHALEDKDGNSILDPIEEDKEKKKVRRLQRFVYLLAFAIVAITCLVVVIIIQRANSEQITPPPNKTCPTAACSTATCTKAACVSQSAYIMNKMDTSVDPCSDFYTFSCGNWEKTTPLPPSKVKYGTFAQLGDEIQDILHELMKKPGNTYKGASSTAIAKAKSLYSMCMDEATINDTGVEPALQLIKDLGSWTLTSDATSGTFDPQKWSIQDALLSSHKLEFSPFFSMAVAADDKNSSRYIIGFQQSGLSFGDAREYFANHTKQGALKNAFIQFGKDVLSLLGNDDDVEQDITDLYEFEQKLANIFVPENELLDPLKTYHKMTLREFQVEYLGDWFNLEKYVHSMFKGIYNVSMDMDVVVYTPTYFEKLDRLLDDVDQKTLANYIVWHGVTAMVGYLTSPFLEAALKLDKVERGLKEYPAMWKRCLSKAEGSFGFAVGALYIQDYFDTDSKKEVESLFEEIRKAFLANLETVAWMDKDTKDYAREKTEAVDKMLGFPDYILDPEQLDKKYENVTLTEDRIFESKLAINVFYRKKNLWKLRTVPDTTEWSMSPTEVNGYYTSEFNKIVFPAGILRPPLYNPNSPKSFNFGSFGMICGHELTHGFDNRGRRYDKNGNMIDWWSNSSAEGFDKQSKCFVDFYNNYVVNGTHLDGEHTLSENIADNGGMRTAYQAYQSWRSEHTKEDVMYLPGLNFTSDQLFFVGMAQTWCSHYTDEYLQQAILTDEHSISKYRVLGSMANSDVFAEAFQCPADSPMNPAHKCRVW